MDLLKILREGPRRPAKADAVCFGRRDALRLLLAAFRPAGLVRNGQGKRRNEGPQQLLAVGQVRRDNVGGNLLRQVPQLALDILF